MRQWNVGALNRLVVLDQLQPAQRQDDPHTIQTAAGVDALLSMPPLHLYPP